MDGWALGLLAVEYLGRKYFPALVWPQIVCPPQVVEECEGSSVGAQLLNPGLSELCHPEVALFQGDPSIWINECMGCAGIFANCSVA